MPKSVRPHRQQPTRLPRPRDSPSKNTGVGCHFLLQCMKVKSESEVAQSCPTLSDPMDCNLPGSSTHGILQARVPTKSYLQSSYLIQVPRFQMPVRLLYSDFIKALCLQLNSPYVPIPQRTSHPNNCVLSEAITILSIS